MVKSLLHKQDSPPVETEDIEQAFAHPEETEPIASQSANTPLFFIDEEQVTLAFGSDDQFFDHDDEDFFLGESSFDTVQTSSCTPQFHAEGLEFLFDAEEAKALHFDMSNMLADGCEDLDVLLTGASNLNDIKAMMLNGDIVNAEVVITGQNLDNLESHNVDTVFSELGITKQDDGSLSMGNWQAGTTESYDGKQYTEFTSAEHTMSIMVETAKLTIA